MTTYREIDARRRTTPIETRSVDIGLGTALSNGENLTAEQRFAIANARRHLWLLQEDIDGERALRFAVRSLTLLEHATRVAGYVIVISVAGAVVALVVRAWQWVL